MLFIIKGQVQCIICSPFIIPMYLIIVNICYGILVNIDFIQL